MKNTLVHIVALD